MHKGEAMHIAVLGAGAMGSLFGGYLSRKNDVLLIDVSQPVVDAINSKKLQITEPDGSSAGYAVHAVTNVHAANGFKADLVIVFVKAMYSRDALQSIAPIMDAGTCLMSLQNGVGHEDLLLEFADKDHVLIGTTQHNCAVLAPGSVRHGGSGATHLARVSGSVEGLSTLAENFTACGLQADCSANYKQLVWEKLLTNVSASALTGALQVPLGFIVSDSHAWILCQELVREAVSVAKADGAVFDVVAETEKVRQVCVKSPEGITSICADIKAGRRTEVDTISGGVVKKAKRLGISAPYHEMMVELIHSLEGKAAITKIGG